MMKNTAQQHCLQQEIAALLTQQKSLILATNGTTQALASYAPFALGEKNFYVLLSDLACHSKNLQQEPKASLLIIEDESKAETIFTRKRIQYNVISTEISRTDDMFKQGTEALLKRHGETIEMLISLSDFRLFSLAPQSGSYIKGFGKAYRIKGNEPLGQTLEHIHPK